MEDIYQDLLKGRSSLEASEEIISGFDDYLSDKKMVKMASIDDFFHFLRVGKNTLIHKSNKDLWRVAENEGGDVVIERLFDPTTKEPLKV